MKIGVFGGSGYLGSNSINFLSEAYDVISLSRNESLPEGLQIVLDCSFPSHIRSKKVKRNYLKLLDERSRVAAKLDIRYIYIGSFSSRKNSISKYGLFKYEAEELVKVNYGVILRTALVVNVGKPGGRYGELVQIVSKLPIIPLPHQDFFNLQISNLQQYEETLQECIEILIPKFQHGELVAPFTNTSLKELIMDVPRTSNKLTIGISMRKSRIIEWFVTYLPLGKFDSLKSIVGEKNVI